VAFTQMTFEPAPKSSPTEILFQNGIHFETTSGEPNLPRGLRMDEALDADERIGLLVQVEAPVHQEWIGLLERAGARIYRSKASRIEPLNPHTPRAPASGRRV